MDDFDAELDKTVAAAQSNVKLAKELAASAGAAIEAKKVWLEKNSVPDDATERFLAKLAPEERDKAEAEQEQFFRELRHDLDAAVDRVKSASQPKKQGGKKMRSMA